MENNMVTDKKPVVKKAKKEKKAAPRMTFSDEEAASILEAALVEKERKARAEYFKKKYTTLMNQIDKEGFRLYGGYNHPMGIVITSKY